jgi:hypothetical protein
MAKEIPVLDDKEARVETAPPSASTSRQEPPAPASSDQRSKPRGSRLLRRWHLIPIGIVLALLALLAAFASHLFDERLRLSLEGKINQRLTGYRVTLGHAHLNPLNLALGLRDMVIRQDANPEPPVANVPHLRLSVEWPALLTFRLVSNAVFDQPRVHIDLQQLQGEARDKIHLKDRGWQQAFESIFPLKVDHFEVHDGELAYIDVDPDRPLLVSHWDLDARDIRNIHSLPGTYPSTFHTEGVVFDTGRARVDGNADFLEEPYFGVHALYSVEGIPLDRLRPIIARANLSLQGGVLASKGEFEESPKVNIARIDDLTVRGLRLDYLHTTASVAVERKREAEAKAAVKSGPASTVRIRRLRLLGGELGFTDQAKNPPLRVFLDGLDLEVTDLAVGPESGPTEAKLTGRFMGTGQAHGKATFRPSDSSGPNFDLALAIENADLPKVNDLLRSYGKFDVAAGTFSVYSEMAAKKGRIDGYVKPLFQNIQVYDPKKDAKKPVLKKLYEKVVGVAAKVVENHQKDDVATKIDISGPLDAPHTSLWETFRHLLSNAFVKAILPGFDREMGKLKKGK